MCSSCFKVQQFIDSEKKYSEQSDTTIEKSDREFIKSARTFSKDFHRETKGTKQENTSHKTQDLADVTQIAVLDKKRKEYMQIELRVDVTGQM